MGAFAGWVQAACAPAHLDGPDGFRIYTFNDHGAFGAVEVVENLLVDFDEFKEGWRDRWAICEAMVLYFLGHASEEMFM